MAIAVMTMQAAEAGVAQVQAAQKQVEVAVMRVISGLSSTERELACAQFADPRRTKWNYLPGTRFGARFDQLDPSSREDVNVLLRTTLSAKGLAKVCEIHDLEAFLGRARPESYNREAYTLALFGDPSKATAWGFRYEGHHLSLNFTSPGGEQPSDLTATPMFLGAAPFAVPDGKTAGVKPLGEERDLAFALLRSLTPEQLSQAVIGTTAPGDITAGPSVETVETATPAGIAAGNLSGDQRGQLLALLRVFAGRLRGELADAEIALAQTAGFDNIHFAWMGAQDESHPHYYRIQGPTLLVEFDCTSGTVDHVHTIWRDPQRDFGRDILRDHLRDHYEDPRHAPTKD